MSSHHCINLCKYLRRIFVSVFVVVVCVFRQNFRRCSVSVFRHFPVCVVMTVCRNIFFAKVHLIFEKLRYNFPTPSTLMFVGLGWRRCDAMVGTCIFAFVTHFTAPAAGFWCCSTIHKQPCVSYWPYCVIYCTPAPHRDGWCWWLRLLAAVDYVMCSLFSFPYSFTKGKFPRTGVHNSKQCRIRFVIHGLPIFRTLCDPVCAINFHRTFQRLFKAPKMSDDVAPAFQLTNPIIISYSNNNHFLASADRHVVTSSIISCSCKEQSATVRHFFLY